MKRIIITADLGHFRAYRITQAPQESTRTDLLESYDSIEGHGKLGEKLSDTAGRFIGGGGRDKTSRGYGQQHNLEHDMEKKAAKMIAHDIEAVINAEKCNIWYLSAPEKINGLILNNLSKSIKEKMTINLSADLTTVDKSEVLGYFE